MIKSLLKSYKERLSKELSSVSKTQSKKISRVTEQVAEFDTLEAQLLSWGLTKYIPSFKIQVKAYVLCTYVCMCCMYACMYVCMYVCMC